MPSPRRIVRLFGLLLIIGSVLVLVDVAMTAWGPGEIVTGAQNHFITQPHLRHQLGTVKDTPVRKVLPRAKRGTAVAKLKGPHVDTIVVQGKRSQDLAKAPGMWNAQPGSGKSVVISGHRTTHGAPFMDIDQIKRGSVLKLRTRRGTYRYRVQRTIIVKPDEVRAATKDRGRERLVLTACEPKFSASHRILVISVLF